MDPYAKHLEIEGTNPEHKKAKGNESAREIPRDNLARSVRVPMKDGRPTKRKGQLNGRPGGR